MTDIAVRDQTTELVATNQDAAFARLAEWAQSAKAAYQVAQSLVQTSFVPEAFRGKPHEATAAILAGAEVGLSPMAALRSFDIINGTAAPRANTLRAVVQSRGHEIRVVESTATRAIVEGRRRGEANWQRSVWTLDRARQLGLTNKANWKNQPQAMLIARATSECARLIASDAILGIAYSSEELDDAADPVPAGPEVRPARRTARRAPVPAAEAPEPSFDDEPATGPAPERPDDPITDGQQRKLHALLRDQGLGDRDKGLARICEILGRDVASTKEMSKRDAIRVINALEAPPEPDEPAFDDEPWPDTAQPGGGS